MMPKLLAQANRTECLIPKIGMRVSAQRYGERSSTRNSRVKACAIAASITSRTAKYLKG